MANPLTTFGLMMTGADKARGVQQDYDLGQERISAAQRQGKMQDQSIELGQMGLEDTRRTRDTAASVREAGAAAIGQGKTFSGSLLDMSAAAAAKGDAATALQYRTAYKQLEDTGAKEVIHAALTNSTPGERPDLVQVMNQYEKTKDTTGAVLDPDGTLTVTRASGTPTKINVGRLAEIMGMVAAPKIHNIPAGGVGVMTQPGKAPIQITAPKTYAENPQQG
jgi:hypothetical protein